MRIWRFLGTVESTARNFLSSNPYGTYVFLNPSVGDPADPHVFGPPGSGYISRGMDPEPDHKDVEQTEIMLANKILMQNFDKKLNFKTEDYVTAKKL